MPVLISWKFRGEEDPLLVDEPTDGAAEFELRMGVCPFGDLKYHVPATSRESVLVRP